LSFSSEVLSIETKSGVGTLWLDRPEKRNAMSPPMWKDLPGALSALCEDGETRAIILAGKGKSFCVGLDW
jgi:enoyl-CoA hydratase